MGKGKFVRQKNQRKEFLKTFILNPYGSYKFSTFRGQYFIDTEDTCPRCKLDFGRRVVAKTFLNDIKAFIKDIETTCKDYEITLEARGEIPKTEEITTKDEEKVEEEPSPILKEKFINEKPDI